MRMRCFKCFGQGPPVITTWCRSASTQISGSFWRDTRACQPACSTGPKVRWRWFGLYFALKEDNPVVWMLNPLELNERSCKSPSPVREFPLVWHNPDGVLNPAFENLRGAREQDGPGVPLPLAIHPTYVHPRLRSQRSCFTIHGKRKGGLDTLVPKSILRRYVVDPAYRQSMFRDVGLLGITDSVVFPDLDGLATELKERFF